MLENMQPQMRVNRCGVNIIWDKLDTADRVILAQIMNDKAWSHRHMASELTRLGFPISREVVQKHRLNLCQCWRQQEGLGEPK